MIPRIQPQDLSLRFKHALVFARLRGEFVAASSARLQGALNRQGLHRLVVRQEHLTAQLGQQMAALQTVEHGAFDF